MFSAEMFENYGGGDHHDDHDSEEEEVSRQAIISGVRDFRFAKKCGNRGLQKCQLTKIMYQGKSQTLREAMDSCRKLGTKCKAVGCDGRDGNSWCHPLSVRSSDLPYYSGKGKNMGNVWDKATARPTRRAPPRQPRRRPLNNREMYSMTQMGGLYKKTRGKNVCTPEMNYIRGTPLEKKTWSKQQWLKQYGRKGLEKKLHTECSNLNKKVGGTSFYYQIHDQGVECAIFGDTDVNSLTRRAASHDHLVGGLCIDPVAMSFKKFKTERNKYKNKYTLEQHNKYLPGCTRDRCRKYQRLEDAMNFCIRQGPGCGGVTAVRGSKFETRKGSRLRRSSRGESSWQKI